jgi:hypothetical protein
VRKLELGLITLDNLDKSQNSGVSTWTDPGHPPDRTRTLAKAGVLRPRGGGPAVAESQPDAVGRTGVRGATTVSA